MTNDRSIEIEKADDGLTAEELEFANQLGNQITKLYVLMRRPLLGLEVSIARMRLLSYLHEGGPQRIKQLAWTDQVSQPSVTNMVDSLEKLGWVTRRTDPTDARAVLVEITEAGRSQLMERRRVRAAYISDRLRAMPARQRRALEKAVGAYDELIGLLVD